MSERLVAHAAAGAAKPATRSQTCFDPRGDLYMQVSALACCDECAVTLLQTFPDCTLFCVASQQLYEDAADPGSLLAAAREADGNSGQDSEHPILLLNVDAPRFEILYNYMYNLA